MLKQGKWKQEAPKPSETFHAQFESVISMLEEQPEKQSKKQAEEKRKKPRWRKAAVAFTAAAAAVGIFAGVCVQNPVWASNLPLVGFIFEKVADKLTFGENYSQYTTPVSSPDKETDALCKTDQGMTVTLSETYCSGSALYLSLLMESETPFESTFEGSTGPLLQMQMDETYSFLPETYPSLVSLSGDFIDDKTYAGVLRLDLNERNVGGADIPSEFTLGLNISQIIGYLQNPDKMETGYTSEELEAMSDEEWNQVMQKAIEESGFNTFPNVHENWWTDGAWNFQLDIKGDDSQKQVVEVKEMNEEGIGVDTIVKTPFEITVNDWYQDESAAYDYFPFLLDADGKVMDGYDGLVNTVAVKGHDVSTVTVYLCDYIEAMDEIKGHKTEAGFKDLLEERAKYKTQVHFE